MKRHKDFWKITEDSLDKSMKAYKIDSSMKNELLYLYKDKYINYVSELTGFPINSNITIENLQVNLSLRYSIIRKFPQYQ